MNSFKLLTDYFEHIYVINLPHRTDRKREMEEQLNSIGLSFSHSKITLFPANKPDHAGEFPNIGAKGCFTSHLNVLTDAVAKGYENILILEDDLNFSKDFNNRVGNIINALNSQDWSFFYGGYDIKGESLNDSITGEGIYNLSTDTYLTTSHFVALKKKAIKGLVTHLNRINSRKSGDPLGGPMHVDGAYLIFRQSNPDFKTFIATPELGYQRASKTDIHSNKWFDRLPIIRVLISFTRKIKNKLNAT